MTTALAKKDKRRDPREEAFLENFFLGEPGVTKGLIKESALKAGYDESKAEAVGYRIIERFNKLPFSQSLIAAGLTKPLLALALKNYVDDGGPDGRHAIKTALAAYGEGEGMRQPSITVTGQGAQVLVVVGKTDEKMRRLKAGNQITEASNGQSEQV